MRPVWEPFCVSINVLQLNTQRSQIYFVLFICCRILVMGSNSTLSKINTSRPLCELNWGQFIVSYIIWIIDEKSCLII